MYASGASVSCWCGSRNAGPCWTVCKYQCYTWIVSGRLQQCTERWTDLRLRWQRLQFDVRNEIDDLRSRCRTHQSKELSKHPNVSWIMLACGTSYLRFGRSHLCERMQNAFDELWQACVRGSHVLLYDSAAAHRHRQQLRCTRLSHRLYEGHEAIGMRQRWLHLQFNLWTQNAQLWVSGEENVCEFVGFSFSSFS